MREANQDEKPPCTFFSPAFEVIGIPKRYFVHVFLRVGVRWRSGGPAEVIRWMGTAI